MVIWTTLWPARTRQFARADMLWRKEVFQGALSGQAFGFACFQRKPFYCAHRQLAHTVD